MRVRQASPHNAQCAHMTTLWVYALVLAALAAPHFANAKTVTITTDAARRDVDGAFIDAHDGMILEHRGAYFLYGAVCRGRYL